MEVKRVVTGYLDENCYVLIENGTCLVVDPGDNYNKIKDEIGDNKVLGVLITHSHFDHIGALRKFLTKKSIKIFKKSNIEDGKEYEIGEFKFKAYNTPGHSADSVSFYFEEDKALFIGDFVFKGSIGRCDLPSGSSEKMAQSIKKLKSTFPEDTVLYPGHYDTTTLKEEIKTNPYLK